MTRRFPKPCTPPRLFASKPIRTRYAFTQGSLENFTAGIGYFYTGDRKPFTASSWVADFPFPAWPGYDRVDLLFSYSWKDYLFQLNVGNVTDEYHFATAPHGVALTEGLPRNFKFTMTYSW